MNVISVTGGTKKQRELVESMVWYCIDRLGLNRMRTLDIAVELTKIKDACGYCVSLTERDFELEINKTSSLRRILETVAHEMVHVKQYARKELTQDVTVWKGQPVEPDTEYWDLPWEIEAHGREIGLFIRWAQAHNHAYKKWAQDPLQ